MPILFKWEKDWADEFDMTGFRVISENIWNAFQTAAKKMEYPQEFYFGTNEEYTFDNINQLMNGIKTIEITDEEAEVIKKCFAPSYGNSINFGWEPIEQVLETLSREDYDTLVGEEQY